MTLLNPFRDSSAAPGAAPFFVTGGTVPLSAESYVSRQADTVLLQSLQRGEFCYVLNTRQMGKSSLMVRAAQRLRAEGRRVAVVDLTAVGNNLSPEQWYVGLLGLAAEQLDLDDALFAAWSRHKSFGPMQRFLMALKEAALDDTGDSVVIFVDEIDAVRSLSFATDEFFAGIRECYNRRATDSSFDRLTFCLLGVASPADLISDTRMSPFNIGRRIELRDFTPAEASPLAEGLGAGAETNALVLKRVLHWTGGHPYMTQRLCDAVAQAGVTDPKQVDSVCSALFLSRAARDADDNLAFVRNRLLGSGVELAALLDLYRRVRSRRRIADDETNPLTLTLKLSGVARVEDGVLHVRNRIYEHVFDDDWIDAHLPNAEVRRQRRAYQLGVARTAAVSGVVLLVMVSLAGVATNRAAEARRARDRAAEQEQIAHARLSRAYVESGMRLLDSGDAAGALAPLAEAMAMDRNDLARMAVHRIRFASALALAPRIERMWFGGGPVKWAELSPDGRLAAAGCDNGEAHVWETATGRALPIAIRHKGSVNHVAFSPDGTRLVTCGDDARAVVWDLRSGRVLCVLPLPAHPGGLPHVKRAAWSQDGRFVAMAGYSTILGWDVTGDNRSEYWKQKGVNVKPIPGSAGATLVFFDISERADWVDLAFSPRADRLAFVGGNFLGYETTFPTGPAVPIRPQGIGGCFCGLSAQYSEFGDRLLVAGTFGPGGERAGACILDSSHPLDTRAASRAAVLLRHGGRGSSAGFSPDGRQVVTTSDDQTARVWDLRTGRPITPPLPHGGKAVCARFSPDGRRVVTASLDGTAIVWDARTGRPVCSPLRHSGAIVSVEFSRDGRRVLTAGRDGTVRIWSLPPAAPAAVVIKYTQPELPVPIANGSRFALVRKPFSGRTVTASQVEIHDTATGRWLWPGPADAPKWSRFMASAGGRRILLYNDNTFSTSGRRYVQVWDGERGRPLSPMMTADSAELSPSGSLVLLRDVDGSARLVDAVSGRDRIPPFNTAIEQSPALTSGRAEYGRFTPDERGLVVADPAGNVRILDTSTGRSRPAVMPHDARVWMAAVVADGHGLFTWTTKGVVRLWSTDTGNRMSPPVNQTGYRDAMVGIKFSANGRLAVTWGLANDTASHLWSLGPMDARAPAVVPKAFGIGPSTRVAFSPDGGLFAAPMQGSRLRSCATGAEVTQPLDHGAPVTDIAFSPDGRHILSSSEDGSARIWETNLVRPLTPPMVSGKTVRQGVFSPDGRLVATACDGGPVRLWDASTGEPVSARLPIDGAAANVDFVPDGAHLTASSGYETRYWAIPNTTQDMGTLMALANLLSGQRIDANVGTIPIDVEGLRSAWRRADKQAK